MILGYNCEAGGELHPHVHHGQLLRGNFFFYLTLSKKAVSGGKLNFVEKNLRGIRNQKLVKVEKFQVVMSKNP